jgi:CheY-like chemotaxis protein
VRILLAGDDPIIRMDLAEALEELGHEVLEAATGQTARALIEHPDHIGMVITDVHMSCGDGISVAVKARQQHPDVPVIFVTGRADVHKMQQVPKPYSYLLKPFSREQFAEAVQQVIAAQDDAS